MLAFELPTMGVTLAFKKHLQDRDLRNDVLLSHIDVLSILQSAIFLQQPPLPCLGCGNSPVTRSLHINR